MNDSQKIFEAYKPFRNKIRETSIEDSLYVIWAYSQNLAWQIPIPNNIEVHDQYYFATNFAHKGIYPWTLELLAKEVILNAEDCIYSEHRHKSFKKSNTFSIVINLLNKIDNVISIEYLNPENILLEFPRIANRQFPWQKISFDESIIRFHKIFNHNKVNRIIQEVTGLSSKDVLRIGMLLMSFFLKHPAVALPINIDIPEFSHDKISRFLSCFSKDIISIKDIIKREHRTDDQYMYSGVALRFYPLIEMRYKGKLCLICPVPTLLLWRITSGMYFEICGHKYFSEAIGESFQQYVGDIFEKVFKNTEFRTWSEVKYRVGKLEKSSIDWILNDSSAVVFVECKCKRMQLDSKIRIDDKIAITKDIGVLSSAIVQCYKTINDYTQGLYPHFEYDCNKLIYPLIVTLEAWYLFTPAYQAMLDQSIIEGLQKNSLSENYIINMPYSFCSIEEFEEIAQIIKLTGIKQFFEPKVQDREKNSFVFDTYNGHEFPEERKKTLPNIFIEEYNSLIHEFCN